MPTDRTLFTVSDLVRGVLEVEDDADDLLRLAARAEFDGSSPERVTAWLSDRGVELT